MDNTLVKLNAEFFDTIRSKLDSWFDKAESTYGNQTLGQANSALQSKDGAQDPFSIDLPSPASWIMNKILHLLSGDDNKDILSIDASGIQQFTNTLDSLLSMLVTDKTKTDFANAIKAIQDLILNITTKGAFDGTTFASLLHVFHQLIALGTDVVESLMNHIIMLFQWIVKRVVAFFEQPMNLPGISWLYEHLTGNTMPSFSSVFSFAVAIPFTIFYKIVFNEAPFSPPPRPKPGSLGNVVPEEDEKLLHKTMGGLGAVFGFYNLYDDIFIVTKCVLAINRPPAPTHRDKLLKHMLSCTNEAKQN
jgi:hypothetical protein